MATLALGTNYTWTGEDSDLWAQELNWVKPCGGPPELCPEVDGYPDDARDNARILWSLGQWEAGPTIELSTETIDQLLVGVEENETSLTLDFSSEDQGGNTLTCDNIWLNPVYGTLELTVTEGAEIKTVD